VSLSGTVRVLVVDDQVEMAQMVADHPMRCSLY